MQEKLLRVSILNWWLAGSLCFVADSWSISQVQSNNSRAPKWLGIAHYRIGVCTQHRGAKH